MLKFILFVFLTISMPLQVLSGQFGLEVGDTKEFIISKGVRLENDSCYWYYTEKLPKGNSQLDNYSLLITPLSGLCRIVGRTPEIQTNSFGSQLISKFEFFETALNNKYGKSEKFNFVRSGSIWNDEKYWMMGLLKKERYLTAGWHRENKNKLPNYLNYILLDTHANGIETGVISLNYEFSNTEDCFKEEDAADAENL